jgi:hypothetical protein
MDKICNGDFVGAIFQNILAIFYEDIWSPWLALVASRCATFKTAFLEKMVLNSSVDIRSTYLGNGMFFSSFCGRYICT